MLSQTARAGHVDETVGWIVAASKAVYVAATVVVDCCYHWKTGFCDQENCSSANVVVVRIVVAAAAAANDGCFPSVESDAAVFVVAAATKRSTTTVAVEEVLLTDIKLR